MLWLSLKQGRWGEKHGRSDIVNRIAGFTYTAIHRYAVSGGSGNLIHYQLDSVGNIEG